MEDQIKRVCDAAAEQVVEMVAWDIEAGDGYVDIKNKRRSTVDVSAKIEKLVRPLVESLEWAYQHVAMDDEFTTGQQEDFDDYRKKAWAELARYREPETEDLNGNI